MLLSNGLVIDRSIFIMSTPDILCYWYNGSGHILPCGHESGKFLPIHRDEKHNLRKERRHDTLLVCWCGATYQSTQVLGGGEVGVQVPDEDVQAAGKEHGHEFRN